MPNAETTERRRLKREAYEQEPFRDANAYRIALEKAAYADAGRQYGAGLGDISSYLARSGPLADSGAGTALRARLASQIYGAAAGRIGGGYADYLRQAIQAQRNFRQQWLLMKRQRDLQQQQSGPGQFLGGALGAGVGFLAGGPYGAAAGYGAGSRIGGGGGGYASDAYYG